MPDIMEKSLTSRQPSWYCYMLLIHVGANNIARNDPEMDKSDIKLTTETNDHVMFKHNKP